MHSGHSDPKSIQWVSVKEILKETMVFHSTGKGGFLLCSSGKTYRHNFPG
jgi:hypothetical protein